MTKACNKHSYEENTALSRENGGDKEVVEQITSVKSYLHTLRKHPGGIKFGGKYRTSNISPKETISKLANETKSPQKYFMTETLFFLSY